MPGLVRSAIAETCRPILCSWSPCRNISSSNNSTQCLLHSHACHKWPRSATCTVVKIAVCKCPEMHVQPIRVFGIGDTKNLEFTIMTICKACSQAVVASAIDTKAEYLNSHLHHKGDVREVFMPLHCKPMAQLELCHSGKMVCRTIAIARSCTMRLS